MKGEKITKKGGQLIVPDYPIIPYIEGDGTGPDIWRAASYVIEQAVKKSYGEKRKIIWLEVLAGEKAYKTTGEWLPQSTLDTIQEYLICIKGPLTTPVGGGIRSLNVALRQTLDLYACVRPVRYFKGVPSPLKNPEGTHLVIFRENTEDVYAGIEWGSGSPECKKVIKFLIDEMGVKKIRFPETSSIGIKPISEEGSKRLVRAAIRYALANKMPSVTLVHKGNIMKFTEGWFRKWGYEVARTEFKEQTFTMEEFYEIQEREGEEKAIEALNDATKSGKLIVKDVIADNFMQQLLTRTKEYSVVATTNLNGDYISDLAAALVGGIGIAPGANINYETGHAVFEATHGTVPKYAGQDKVNPSAVILSGVMMLEYMGWHEAAQLIIKGMEKTISSKKVTYDFHRLMEGATLLKCSEFAKEIVNNFSEVAEPIHS